MTPTETTPVVELTIQEATDTTGGGRRLPITEPVVGLPVEPIYLEIPLF